ncbi:MAG: TlpA disulfide reductase family protein [Nitrospirae bacterium]|nr:TlpA disulfide reductase family protein [Nitrospirota bacterium]
MKNKSFILSLIFISGIIIVFFILRQQHSPRISTVELSSLDIELIDIHKNKLILSDLKGSVVFINFWASWCQTCKDEMPSIERLYRYFSGNPKFKLITILYKDDGDRAFRYMNENGYTFQLYLDPKRSAAQQFRITGIPETFIFDKKGILIKKVTGPLEWDSPNVIETLNNLINEH